jgi:hypothetical protein
MVAQRGPRGGGRDDVTRPAGGGANSSRISPSVAKVKTSSGLACRISLPSSRRGPRDQDRSAGCGKTSSVMSSSPQDFGGRVTFTVLSLF